MDQWRVVQVNGERRGSGYLVGPGLVLTSAHVVPDRGAAVEVFRPGRAGVFGGTVVWRGTPEGRDDAALVRIDSPTWTPPAGKSVEWGRTVTNRAGIVCETKGLPDRAQRPGEAADNEQLLGWFNADDQVVSDVYVMALEGHRPNLGGSPWGGLSGAAVFSGGLLIGVVRSDEADSGHTRLRVAPSYVLHRDAGFREALTEHDGGEPRLRPVEFAGMEERALPVTGVLASPGWLLNPALEVVPFRGRGQELERLGRWAGLEGFGACVVHGPGGQGKTRLARRFAQELGERWAVVWPKHECAEQDLAVLADAVAPTLVVVDYADNRPGQVQALLRAAQEHGGGTPLKVLLLARSAGDWWDRLKTSSDPVSWLLEGTPLVALEPLESDDRGRERAYREAVEGFSAGLSRVRGLEDHPWSRIAAGMPGVPVAPVGARGVLALHMAALADLLDAVPGPSGDDTDATGPPDGDAESRLLEHEQRYWTHAAGASSRLELGHATLHDAMAAAVLVGADDHEQADGLLGLIAGLADQPRDRRDAVVEWIGGLYPGVAPVPFSSLQPDRLAERFIGEHLTKRPELAHRLVQAPQERRARLLTVYSRAAGHAVFNGALDAGLTQLCIKRASLLARVAVEVVVQAEYYQPLLEALILIGDAPETDVPLLVELVDGLPQSSHRLAESAVRWTGRLVRCRREADQDTTEYLPDLASSLNNQAARLAAVGRGEEALEVISEAVTIRRALAKDRPDAFLPNLASSLNNQANSLAAVGRGEEALEVISEAVTIRRALAKDRPDAFLPNLASSLNNQANSLAAVGRGEEALEVISEAVTTYRALVKDRPDAFLPNLAGSLNNQAARLADVGWREEALEVISEAVTIRRALAKARPDAFLPDLAGSLNNQAARLAAVGRGEEALEVISEAVTTYRALVKDRPDAFLPNLAGSLNNQAARLAAVGRGEEALEVISEAVTTYRALVKDRPDAFLPNLAGSLNNQAAFLADVGRGEEALEVISEAVTTYRALVKARPDAFLPDLAGSLNNQAARLADVGRGEEALEVISEAVTTYRALVKDRPDAFLPDLAGSLNNQAARLAAVGRGEEALEVISEAVTTYRALVKDRPDAFLPDLAGSLNNQAAFLAAVGRGEEALEVISEAVTTYRALVKDRPDAFLPDLAGSLNNQAAFLAAVGRGEEALEVISEAVTIRRALAKARPDAFLPDLAGSLNNQANSLAAVGRGEEALEVISEAVTIRRALAKARPDAFLPNLAGSLNNQANSLAAVGRGEEALEVISEAVTIRRALAKARPDAFLPDLAGSLNNQAAFLAAAGWREEALEVISEAVTIRRALTQKRPQVHQKELEYSLRILELLHGQNPTDGDEEA
ncbi:tetratricopeptide repeat protein [Actinosynnema pretiosum]|uniref:Tetratricopeptide repeat protein n=1 Tax=Actinosynnema pretiosum TaxID=42197 RepID=A0A290ZF95_9PSEU|nr:tetratricopeptide repeat protein [Actinosynnema pretiosum]ATE57643.1 hypothetical protein CNX65_33645 [Actinosynnema pretiosum]